MASFDLPAYTDTNSPPCYTNPFDDAAHVLLKPELTDPTTQWPNRQWFRAVLQLQGTQIILQRNTGVLICGRPLSLQGAQAGLATDYHKKSFVFRLRVEGYQLLCAIGSSAAAISWVDALNAAIAVSVDLDERKEPTYQTMASSRIPVTGSLAIDMIGTLRFRQIWSQRKSSLNSAWLRDRLSERSGMGLQQHLENEERILVNSPVAVQQRCTAHCLCSVCFGVAQTRNSLDSRISTPTEIECGSEKAVAFSTKESVDCTDWRIDRVGLARRRLEYARRCAETLTYRAPWASDRYLCGQIWIHTKVKRSSPATVSPW
jgi:hypothetical protein